MGFPHLTITYWWAHLGSNQGPIGYEPTAPPLSYGPKSDIKYYTMNHQKHQEPIEKPKLPKLDQRPEVFSFSRPSIILPLAPHFLAVTFF